MGLHGKEIRCRTVGQIPKNVKKPKTWLSLIWLISFFFVCWNLFCTIANLRIKCVTETKNVSVLIYKNLKIKLSTWLTHLTLRVFLHFWLLWPTVCHGIQPWVSQNFPIYLKQGEDYAHHNNTGPPDFHTSLRLCWHLPCLVRKTTTTAVGHQRRTAFSCFIKTSGR